MGHFRAVKNVNLQTVNDGKKVKNPKKVFAPEDKVGDTLRRDLEEVCGSLTFISETDADVYPLLAGRPASRSLADYLAALDLTSDQTEEREFGKFFDRLTSEKDWHGPREKKRSARWQQLREVLNNNLDDIRVIRAGRIRIDIYIVGVDASGRLAGVKTKAIET